MPPHGFSVHSSCSPPRIVAVRLPVLYSQSVAAKGPGGGALTRPSPTAFDLLRAPFAGSLLRARYGRRALQGILLVLSVAVITDGFFGHPMAPMNMAGVLPWTYGRAVVVVALLAAGNFFCMACPFTLPRELGRRLGLATRHWPHSLRTKWIAGTFWYFFGPETFAGDSPRLTAWIQGYFMAPSRWTFFYGASFCKYVAPSGSLTPSSLIAA